jgi:hypothetical protein
MSATLAVRHTVADYAAWRVVYDEVEIIRSKYGCTAKTVDRSPDDANDLFITHVFPTVADANGFAGDPEFKSAMARAGVTSAPRIEIFTSA